MPKLFDKQVGNIAYPFSCPAIKAITAPLSAWILNRYFSLAKGPRPTKIRVMHIIGFELSFVKIDLLIIIAISLILTLLSQIL
ncbi:MULTISPECIES: hypothetical protein [Proteus]|uniref:hypothetical protein n=1 Tax=Proteus TaxID=583 RepID=UPI000D6E781D|nr:MULTISPECIES: hypothetical protein [Proteus]NBM69760.1 hypothetical protein [Proteus sp. G2663]NBM92699.1 hypothetical protein [Proteus sp. G2662]NBN24364.1 hypothetical protein [Proteus sp. G2657]QPT34439.1 hypothetical protein I6G31_03210 [Proteus penneri]SUC00000.1 Uncharacterised protein [Proteus penneri]